MGGKLRPVMWLICVFAVSQGSLSFVACCLLSWYGCFKQVGTCCYSSLARIRSVHSIRNLVQSGFYPHHSLKTVAKFISYFYQSSFLAYTAFGVIDHSLSRYLLTYCAGYFLVLFFLPWPPFAIFFEFYLTSKPLNVWMLHGCLVFVLLILFSGFIQPNNFIYLFTGWLNLHSQSITFSRTAYFYVFSCL